VFLAGLLVGVVLGIATCCEIAAQTHRDGAGNNLGKASGDDEMSVGNSTCKPRRESEWHGQTVRHTDDDVADGVACGEVLLNVWRHWHGLQQSALTYVLSQAEKTPERELGGAIDRRAFLRNLRGQRPDVTTGGRSPALASICSDVTLFRS
jgi:hypothetical protein